MTLSPWEQRIARAEELAKQYRYAAEILGFYVHIAHFQEQLHRSLSEALPIQTIHKCPPLTSVGIPGLTSRFEAFLQMAMTHGPNRLGEISRDVHSRGAEVWAELLNEAWGSFSVSNPAELLTAAFLQPCAELLRSRALKPEGWPDPSLCPFCGRKPGFGILRPLGEGAARSMCCSFCVTEWPFRRILCPGCGEQEEHKLPVFTAGETIRLECCDSCKTYIKTIDMTKDGRAEPMVDELAAVPLDLWAQERGYAKLHVNILGM